MRQILHFRESYDMMQSIRESEVFPVLEIQNLSFSAQGEAGRVEILNGINLTIPDRCFVVITGPNGGGKTSLARAIMGLIDGVEGKILWNGTDLTGLSITERARLGISYSFQQPPRFKGLRVSDLLQAAAGRDLSHAECCEYLTQVGLCARDYVDRDVDASLSGGEVKRIEIATILAKDSPLMIFDEPEAGIDLWSFARLTETFRQIHEQKTATILIISHQERIIRLADEIILVSGGQITDRGSVEEIYPKILQGVVAPCDLLDPEPGKEEQNG